MWRKLWFNWIWLLLLKSEMFMWNKNKDKLEHLKTSDKKEQLKFDDLNNEDDKNQKKIKHKKKMKRKKRKEKKKK